MAPDRLTDKAVRLFTFLSRAQRLKERPVMDADSYASGRGQVLWFHRLPTHDAVRWSGCPESPDLPILSVDRVRSAEPPLPDPQVQPWIRADLSDPGAEPSIPEPQVARNDLPSPQVAASFEAWLPRWQEWAEVERRDRPVRDVHKQLFLARNHAAQQAEELELVLGLGVLSWRPDGQPMRRHLFTVPVVIQHDETSGRLDVRVNEDAGLTAEMDMIPPDVIPNRDLPETIAQRGSEYVAHPMDRTAASDLMRPIAFELGSEGQYQDEMEPATPRAAPVIAWAPALILRQRSKAGLAAAFERIARQIQQAGSVPAGLRPLLDPNEAPPTQPDPSPGALFDVDGDVFSPLPLNDVQRKILERVDQHAQTLVQGPPGTGKTHTAAALLSHLLAQGKRVLVTAHTDRALYEVRGKLPEEIRQLAVSAIGSGRDDLAELRTAVDTINRAAQERDAQQSEAAVASSLSRVEALRKERQELYSALIAAKERDTTTISHGTFTGTPSKIGLEITALAPQHSWASEHVPPGVSSPPLPDQGALRWLNLLRDGRFESERSQLAARTLRPPMPPAQALSLFDELHGAEAAVEASGHLDQHPARQTLESLPPSTRETLGQRLSEVMAALADTRRLGPQWLSSALEDIRRGFPHVWQERAARLHHYAEQAQSHLSVLGSSRVTSPDEPGIHVPIAESLLAHFQETGEPRLNADGTVRFGLFTAGVLKQGRDFLEHVRVDNRAPATAALVERFLAHVAVGELLAEMERSWPSGTAVPAEDTFAERLSWQAGQIAALEQVLALNDALRQVDADFRANGLPALDWNDEGTVRDYSAAFSAAADRHRLEQTLEPHRAALRLFEETTRWGGQSQDWILDAQRAFEKRDHRRYAAACARAAELAELADLKQERDRLTTTIAETMPTLAEAVADDPDRPEWDVRLGDLAAAVAWSDTAAFLRDLDSLDINTVQRRLDDVEDELRRLAAQVAAERAWSHAVAPDRLTGAARADLTQYAQLARKLGKGTGKYAAKQRAEIREALDRCRAAVPVWIMPLYRVVEQFALEENMFDVVLIDEASQAGLEASFLQYLAPRIVVIGDDKQVSPAAVGVDQNQLRELADQYLHDDRYKASWQDPKRSLFDEAQMRFSGQLTLVEHRRCVPEIIGFSNRIAYEPQGVRLIPVRQFGAQRLDPIQMVRVAGGHEEGTTGRKINRAEARMLVDQIKTCLDDPRYDGLSMGVIGLVGTAQGQLIESMLLDEVPSEIWQERDLRVGSSPEFQGSERDIMFLSMVSSLSPGQRLASMTTEMYMQRFNVAVSRAKDQVWVFHTITTSELNNEEDLRYQLLDYGYGIMGRGRDLGTGASQVVSETERAPGFDSLFEQRVHNRLVERGFTVVPQFEAQGYRIDLVIVGSRARLAVECDGDRWHGPEAYAADLARQRDLERCGWVFHRIRESQFYVDPAGTMQGLWDRLSSLGIRPSDRLAAEAQPEASSAPADQVGDEQRTD